MIEIRFHGRGGQGAVTAAELLAQAAISEGNHAQGFPNFGAERRGAPVVAFLRLSDGPIYTREPVDNPSVVVVLDSTLLGLVDFCSGLRPGGKLIINSSVEREKNLLEFKKNYHVAVLDATAIAMETLGVPIANTAIMGALIKVTGTPGLESLEDPIRHRFGKLADKNIAAVSRAYEEIRMWEPPPVQKQSEEVPKSHKYHIEALHPWKELEIGGDIAQPGSSKDFLTGDWRTTGRPVTDFEKCTKCGLCWIVCPDMAYERSEEGFPEWDNRYCKGCGICVEACPADAIEMRSE